MSIVGNNIANVNTNGFKSGRATFQESLVQTLRDGSAPRGNSGGMNAMQIGLGMSVSSVTNNMNQGTLQSTGIVTDLGIDGEGYFVLKGGQNTFYTRSGNFVFDADGNLTDRASGNIVQGWMADASGTITSGTPVTNIKLPFGETVPGQATTEVKFNSNLDATATTSTATLNNAGLTGIDYINGTATNGAGGQHTLTITGANATNSEASGGNIPALVLTGSEVLGTDLGVVDAGDFAISVDGGTAVPVLGLTTSSTVTDLINAINNLNIGVTASIDTGEVKLTRDFAGVGTTYNIATSVAVATAGSENISNRVFGAADTTAFTASSGVAHTMAVQDSFLATGQVIAGGSTSLNVTIDSLTGLVNGVEGIGGGGVTLTATSGLAAGTAIVDTAATEHRTSLLVYDSLGNEHTLNLTFARSGQTNHWFWEASFDGSESITAGGKGSVEFNEDGSIRTWAADDSSLSLDFEPGTGASAVSVSLDTGSIGRYDGLTQFSSPFTAKAISQDGFGMGNLNSIAIGGDGKITGIFSNGILQDLGQVVLAKFANEDGLFRTGGNLYQQSSNSGQAIVGAAGVNLDATVVSRTLEMSNVDLAEQFVNMIVAQRGFQANARVITTGDEMTTELINLKR